MYPVHPSQNTPNLTEYHQKPSSPMLKHRTWHLNPTVSTGLTDLSIIHTCRPKPLEPYIKRFLTSCNLIRKLGYQKCLEFIFRVTTNKRSNQASSRGTRDDTRKEVRIQKRLNHTEMICQSRELTAGTMKFVIIVQYPNEAPPERQRAVVPRFMLTLR